MTGDEIGQWLLNFGPDSADRFMKPTGGKRDRHCNVTAVYAGREERR